MPTKDGFDPADPLPLFLADRAEQQKIGNARDGTVTSSRVFKASIAIATAAAIAALLLADPMARVADIRASLAGNSTLQPGKDPSSPTIQSTSDASASVQSVADAPASPPAAEASTDNKIADSGPVGKEHAEKIGPSPETLFRQFQAWAAAQDAEPPVKPVQPAQDASADVAKDALAEVAETDSVTQKRRQVRTTHNARAEMRAHNFRKLVGRTRRARIDHAPVQAERRPIQDARAQGQPAQDTPAPSFLPIFGARN